VVSRQHQILIKSIDDLRNEVAKDMYDRIGTARSDFRRTIIIVSTATGVSLLLVITMVSLFPAGSSGDSRSQAACDA
jgi:hypothetical protein